MLNLFSVKCAIQFISAANHGDHWQQKCRVDILDFNELLVSNFEFSFKYGVGPHKLGSLDSSPYKQKEN